MENLILKSAEIGENGFWALRNQLNDFVKENFALLYEGAVRICCNIEDDYYAPRRVQINNTRLHELTGLKYADWHKFSSDYAPTEKQLRQTIKDIQILINAAADVIPAPFSLKINENR